MPFDPITSISSINTYNTANTVATFDPAAYRLDAPNARIVLNDGYTYPTGLRDREAVHITYVCGYTAAPDGLLAVMYGMVMSFYMCRTKMPDMTGLLQFVAYDEAVYAQLR